jgi:RES domain-containing protein
VTKNSRSFGSAEDFRAFKEEVLRERRYFWSKLAEEFLKTVANTSRRRLSPIPAGSKFWRAQLGHRTEQNKASGEKVIKPHPEGRMRPLSDQAIEGRVNPKGIPCLYFATSPEVAMTEVRPWIGSTISLAAFETTRDLKLVDCSQPPSKNSQDPTENAIWAEINEAFAEPVIRSDTTGDYAATQILAEVFKGDGADGVIYKSAFLESGLNLALFDLDCAKLLDTTLLKVEKASFEFAPLDRNATGQPPEDGYARAGREKRKASA